MTHLKRLLLLTTIVIGLAGCSDNSHKNNNTLLIGVTTTLEDSGLLRKLVSAFEQQHNIVVQPVVAGSGQIHKLLALGDLSVAITHDPEGEQALVERGVIDRPVALMQNDFILIGPQDDPAKVKQTQSLDEALDRIIQANALFVSRGDNSGTHQMEKQWWQHIGKTPNKPLYLKTGTGMGATLNVSAERGAYTFVDRATWIAFANKQSLTPLFEDAKRLANTYSLLIKSGALAQEKVVLWRDWISTGAGYRIILDYQLNEQLLFFTVP